MVQKVSKDVVAYIVLCAYSRDGGSPYTSRIFVNATSSS
jgi:hypothetical protein